MNKIAMQILITNTLVELQRFITDNNITFQEGERNSNCVILCGYSQYLCKLKNIPEIKIYDTIYQNIIKPLNDTELNKEFKKVWEYTLKNDYWKWWENKKNKNKYAI